ncbi:hypothetical protein [Vulcaniibacterium tengchongense]|uniref:hypothetical protein n=1 Tax=Vulcaniibacterium tengchongense TaxID=1273429 RepID=UPI000F4EA375|nr:hypothetical protein [Vulcaniibacterium tengchongense]
MRRAALGLWFCGLAVLGLLRVLARALRDADFLADAPTRLWLYGSLGLLALGLPLTFRALRRGRTRR